MSTPFLLSGQPAGGHPSGASEIVTAQMPQRHWPCRCCQQPGNYNQFERCYICKHWTATHYKHKCWQAVTDLRTGRQHVVCNCCIKAATHTSPRAMSIRHRQALPPQLTLSSTQQGQQHSDAAPPQGWAPTSNEALGKTTEPPRSRALAPGYGRRFDQLL